jgi:hypothetical protein
MLAGYPYREGGSLADGKAPDAGVAAGVAFNEINQLAVRVAEG